MEGGSAGIGITLQMSIILAIFTTFRLFAASYMQVKSRFLGECHTIFTFTPEAPFLQRSILLQLPCAFGCLLPHLCYVTLLTTPADTPCAYGRCVCRCYSTPWFPQVHPAFVCPLPPLRYNPFHLIETIQPHHSPRGSCCVLSCEHSSLCRCTRSLSLMVPCICRSTSKPSHRCAPPIRTHHIPLSGQWLAVFLARNSIATIEQDRKAG